MKRIPVRGMTMTTKRIQLCTATIRSIITPDIATSMRRMITPIIIILKKPTLPA